VVDFGVRFYGYTTDAVTGDTQLRRIFPADASDLEFHVRSTAESVEANLPAVVEVLLRVLTPEGARRIAALEAGRTTGDWWEIAGANSKVFTRRVRVPAASL
jgi:electron transfer flavoprotein alpha/beta subunit